MSELLDQFKLPARAVAQVYVHCSASDIPAHDDVSVIRQWHVVGNGWNDVGYHFFIKKNGEIQPGRDIEERPAAQAPFNAGTIAICLHGLLKENFTPEQFDALARLCTMLRDRYAKDKGVTLTFHGHCEVPPYKLCPVFDYKAVLGLNAAGAMTGAPNIRPQADPKPKKGTPVQPEASGRKLLELFMRGADVRALQAALNKAEGYGLVEDGIFGQGTKRALMDYQRRHELGIDGIAGPKTLGTLGL